MATKMNNDSIKQVLNFISARGGGVEEGKLANFIESVEGGASDCIANLCGMNYLGKIYEHASDGLAEVVYVITPKGKDLICN